MRRQQGYPPIPVGIRQWPQIIAASSGDGNSERAAGGTCCVLRPATANTRPAVVDQTGTLRLGDGEMEAKEGQRRVVHYR